MLTPQQVHNLSSLLERQLVFFAGKTLGSDILNDEDKKILKDNGIDPSKVYSKDSDLVSNNFILGMLSNVLGEERTKLMTYRELVKYIDSGQHIPLNEREKATINNLKIQSLADIRSATGRIFQDVNGVVSNELSTARANQEEFIRERVIDGISKRQSFKTIASEIGRLTGDWVRNFNKSVQYISHTALNEGRAAIIERRYRNNREAKLFFLTQPDACNACVKAYLTNGLGSEPRIFTLQELQSNGSNIGRKQADWKPTLSSLHPNCRCLASEYIEDQEWNGTKYVWPEKPVKPVNRPKVRIIFNGEEYYV